MADIPVISGNFPDGTPFAFSLNGAATQRQMERLIELTSILAKKKTKGKPDPEEQARIDALKNSTDQLNRNTQATKANTEDSLSFNEALRNLGTVTNVVRGNLTSAFNGINTTSMAFAASMGGMVGQLLDYSGQLGQAMQRGVSGGIMDFAIAAKTGGITLAQMTKALEESGGSFAMLGNGATDGAKQFGSLISEVRYATAEVGNLGLNNEQLATLTAQQVKVAVAQGFRGRAANALVIENTKVFSEELDNLANRTGKSVLELASAAQKLALDPIVSNFVATARSGSQEVSQAINSFAANMEGLFGKAGEQLRTDALQNALAGLPLTMTEAGKNLQLASASVYGELQNQANRAAAGQTISEEDTKRLRELVLREVDARRTELTYMANIKGAAGDAAKQLLSMAAEARNYNPEAAAKRREEDKAAQAFVASTNQLRANLQQLSIPILNLLNGVNWTLLTDILRGFTATLEFLLSPLTLLGKILSDTGLGSVVGGLLGFAAVAAFVVAGFTAFKGTLGVLTETIKKHAASIAASTLGIGRPGVGIPGDAAGKTEKPRYRLDPTTGKPVLVGPTAPTPTTPTPATSRASKLGKFVSDNAITTMGVATTLLGGVLSMAGDSKLAEDADSTWGKIASEGGKILEVSGLLVSALSMITGSLAGFGKGLGVVATFLSKQLMTALATFKTGLLAGKAGDALGGLGGRMSGMGKHIAKIGGAAAVGFGAYQMYDTEQQRKSGEISDKQATIENSSTVGGTAGGIGGAVLGTMIAGPLGTVVGGMLGSALGTGIGHVVGGLLTSDESGISKEIKDTQTSAIDANNMKDTEGTKQLAQLNKNIETLVASSDANLMVNGKIASLTDNNSRYLRGTAFGSA